MAIETYAPLYRLNATTEEELLAGATRTEQCMCGGYITAHAHPDAIRGAVMEHQSTPRHRAWWRAQASIDQHLTGTPVPDELLLRGRRCPCGGHG